MVVKNGFSKKIGFIVAVCILMSCLSLYVFAEESSKVVTVDGEYFTYYAGNIYNSADMNQGNNLLSLYLQNPPQTKQYDDGVYKGTLTYKGYKTKQDQISGAPQGMCVWKLCYIYSGTVTGTPPSKVVTVDSEYSIYYAGDIYNYDTITNANELLSLLLQNPPQTKQYDDGVYKGTLTYKGYKTKQDQISGAPYGYCYWKLCYTYSGTVTAT